MARAAVTVLHLVYDTYQNRIRTSRGNLPGSTRRLASQMKSPRRGRFPCSPAAGPRFDFFADRGRKATEAHCKARLRR
jgi:hypothetical protein